MERLDIVRKKEDLLLMDNRKAIELILRVYLGRDDLEPLHWYIFDRSTVHAVHDGRWITVTAEELRGYFSDCRH